MEDKKFLRLYAVFKAGYLGHNILETYYPFFASIIYEEQMETVDEHYIQKKFTEKYNFSPTILFIRQVLCIGIENKSIQKKAGKYTPALSEIKKYVIDSSSFDTQWHSLIALFETFCKANCPDILINDIETEIINYIDGNDYKIIAHDELCNDNSLSSFEYAWTRFITKISIEDPSIFNFIASLCASNIYKEALFLTSGTNDSFKGLNVYLDSPMVFALLGMDTKERTESYKLLVNDMIAAGCFVQILDNNFNEISGIIQRSANWANSTAYTIDKATKVAKYLHDSEMSHEEIIEYCESLEEKLNDLGITIKTTEYNMADELFQEDESQLFEMVKSKYTEQCMGISTEKEESIRTDVRSIIMIYRERKGRVSVKLQNSFHIMLTINGVLANVSKYYESNKSINSGHIPACVSADLFGTVLWLFTPSSILQYQKSKLLADCYAALQPSKQLLNKYVESLETAKNLGEIDEKKFLFMRSHSVVNDALMNVTKGDYARFTDKTYLEVYDEIKFEAKKEFLDEAEKHAQTLQKLQTYESLSSELQSKNSVLHDSVTKLSSEFENYKKEQIGKENVRFNNKCKFISNVISFFTLAIPYFVLLVSLEFFKSKYSSQVSMINIIHVALGIILSFVSVVIYAKLKKLVMMLVTKFLKRRNNSK